MVGTSDHQIVKRTIAATPQTAIVYSPQAKDFVMTTRRRTSPRSLLVAAATLLFLAACGDSTEPEEHIV
jgi:hypothetical protein